MPEWNQDSCISNHLLLQSSVKYKHSRKPVWLLQHTRSRHWHRHVHNRYESQRDGMGECAGLRRNICRSLFKSNPAHLTHLFDNMDHFKFRSWQIDAKRASPLSSPCPPSARTPSTHAAARSPGALLPLARLANAAGERNDCSSVHLEIFDQAQVCLNIHTQSLVCGKLAFKREAVRQPREMRFARFDFEKFNKLN